MLVSLRTPAQNLIAHWPLDESTSPHADTSGNNINLFQDPNTTPAITTAGIAGPAAWLNFQNPPGIATRLYATNAPLQTDSFGFSFWLNPNYLNQNDNFIAKEMPYNNTAANRIAWQVHVGNLNGQSAEPVELVVYGDNRALGSFYGNVLSSTNLPLHIATNAWFHIAGGYNATSGQLTLFVNGVQSISTNSVPGAKNSDGGPFDLGTGKNGSDYVVFSAGAAIDDVQLYDAPLNAADVAALMANPGQTTNVFALTGISYVSTNGNNVITFNSTPGMIYNVYVSTNLVAYTVADSLTAVSCSTTVTLPKSYVDQVLGAAPRSQLYFRVQQTPGTTAFGSCN